LLYEMIFLSSALALKRVIYFENIFSINHKRVVSTTQQFEKGIMVNR